jgi:hypothetical protein
VFARRAIAPRRAMCHSTHQRTSVCASTLMSAMTCSRLYITAPASRVRTLCIAPFVRACIPSCRVDAMAVMPHACSSRGFARFRRFTSDPRAYLRD